MGDLKKKSVNEKIAEREQRRRDTVHSENTTIDRLALKKANSKDHAISARVNGEVWQLFKQICSARGLTANSCLCMLVSDYVRENKSLLE